ncbi:MAG: hypothetical protein NTW96_24760, partial [Planctomycetia bacterium]|nr:hypothetical protein [Planctomycetia bacterium]
WANRIRLQRCSRKINLCSIASVRTGLCPEDCRFCAQSARYASGVKPQTLDKKQILAAADRAIAAGANCFGLVSSGCRPDDDFIEKLAPIIARITAADRAGCCASLGCLSETQARRRARLTGRLLAGIDAAIEAGEMAPWSYFPRDREAVAAILTAHCQPCPELSRAGCERVPWPCKRWTLWRQTVLVGWCKRWGERAVDGSR